MSEHLPSPQSPETNDTKKPGILRRLANRALGAAHETPEPVNPEAPLGYIEGTNIPKSITRVHIIDPEGKKPTEVRHYRNW